MQVVPRGREKRGPLREKCLSCPLLQCGIGAVHQGQGQKGGGRGDKVEINHGHSREPDGEGYRSVSHCVHRQVVTHRGARAERLPV